MVSSTAAILALLALGYLTIPLLGWIKDRLEGNKMELTEREVKILRGGFLFLVASIVGVFAVTYGW